MDGGQQNPSMPTRDKYVTELTSKLDEWDEKVERITSKSNRNQMDSVLLDDLLQKQAAAHEWLTEVKESDESMWEELKAQAAVASQDYQDVLERASERFKVEGPRNSTFGSQRQEGGSGPGGSQAETQSSESETSTSSESVPPNEGEGSDEIRARSSKQEGPETADSG